MHRFTTIALALLLAACQQPGPQGTRGTPNPAGTFNVSFFTQTTGVNADNGADWDTPAANASGYTTMTTHMKTATDDLARIRGGAVNVFTIKFDYVDAVAPRTVLPPGYMGAPPRATTAYGFVELDCLVAITSRTLNTLETTFEMKMEMQGYGPPVGHETFVLSQAISDPASAVSPRRNIMTAKVKLDISYDPRTDKITVTPTVTGTPTPTGPTAQTISNGGTYSGVLTSRLPGGRLPRTTQSRLKYVTLHLDVDAQHDTLFKFTNVNATWTLR